MLSLANKLLAGVLDLLDMNEIEINVLIELSAKH